MQGKPYKNESQKSYFGHVHSVLQRHLSSVTIDSSDRVFHALKTFASLCRLAKEVFIFIVIDIK